MGVFDRDVLEYDTDNLRSQITRIRKIASDLDKNRTDLRTSLDALQGTWNTTAGKTFFEKYDKLWLEQINDYLALLEDLCTALDYAVSQYDPLTDEFNKIA